MVNLPKTVRALVMFLPPLLLAGCGGGSDGGGGVPDDAGVVGGYTIGGTVAGLVTPANPALFLQNNGGDNLIAAGDGAFTFKKAQADGTAYAVTILQQPAGQHCTVSNGNGTISGASVSSVAVSCVDIVAPKVGATTPANGATGVATEAPVSAAFSEVVVVDGNSFTLSAGANISGAVSFDVTTKVAAFTPATRLERLTTYTATLTSAITDLAGNLLAGNHSWSFTTADGAWGSAALIENNNGGGADTPQIAVNASGKAIAVWQQTEGSGKTIWANRYEGGQWAGAELIGTDDGKQEFNPQIAIDASGNAIVVWEQFINGSGHDIWANRYEAGQWLGPVLMESDAGDAQSPRIAMNGSGTAVVVWQQVDGAHYSIFAKRYEAGSWGSVVQIETDNTGNASKPQIALDASGNAIAVWQHADPIIITDPLAPLPAPLNNIWANRYVAGSGWGSAAAIENGAETAATPKIAFDASGNATAVWSQSDGTRHHIWANRYLAGGAWVGAALIETNNTGAAQFPQIAFDGSGNAMVVWEQFDGTRNNIWANRYVAAGSSWGSAELIESDDTTDAHTPQIAVEAGGNALALWQQGDNNILANRYLAGTGWGSAALIENGAGKARSPQLALDGDNNALAVWPQPEGSIGNNSIYANRFK
jgi:hypothetical protein